MSDLRNQIIRLAHENPELREDLLPLVKEAGRYDVAGHINPHQIVLNVQFDAYGRMHDITRAMTAAEKQLRRYIDVVREACLDANVLWRNQSEIYFAPEGPGRQMKGEIYWSVSDKMDSATMAQLKAAIRPIS